MTTTNLDLPHGGTVAYSRLSLLMETATDHLDALTEGYKALRTGGQVSDDLNRRIEQSYAALNDAHQRHLDTKRWALQELSDGDKAQATQKLCEG